MSSPNNGAPYDQRVMIEVITNGTPRRVHVWTLNGETYVSFASGMSEDDVAKIVATGMGLLKPLDVPALFKDPASRRRRHIETGDEGA